MKIYAPVKDANGTWASVRFVNGVGETNDPDLIEWFKNHGYRTEKTKKTYVRKLEKRDTSTPISDEKCDVSDSTDSPDLPDLPDLESMTPNEIIDWATANGYSGFRNTRNKEKLIEMIRKTRG